MSTVNFDNRNASKIFAVLNEENCEFVYYDMIENIRCELENIFKQDYTSENKNEDNELRSFPSNVIANVIGKSKYYKNINLEIFPIIEIVVRSGYYQGFNFDWNLKIQLEGELIDLEDVREEVVYQTEIYETFSKSGTERYANYAQNFAEKSSQELIEQVEKILTEYTDPLYCVAIFSNGEAVYERCS
jgi:hypothetical protein